MLNRRAPELIIGAVGYRRSNINGESNGQEHGKIDGNSVYKGLKVLGYTRFYNGHVELLLKSLH